MQKQLSRFGLAFMIIATLSLTAFTGQQQNPNQQKGKEKNQGKDQNPGKGNKGNNIPGNDQGKNNQGKNNNPGKNNNQGKNDQDHPGNANKGDNRDQKDQKDNNGNNGNKGRDDGYSWNRENFKDRNKIKNQEKITLCHKFNRGNQEGVTIRVSQHALKAHLNHGDFMGDCPVVNNKRYSDDYLKKRNDYYNYLQESNEQVIYSQSVLDYALTRLADSRLQLNQYRANNMPPAEIERKQVVVTELEQNVSLLQSLIGVAAQLVVNKLM